MKVTCRLIMLILLLCPFNCVNAIGFGTEEKEEESDIVVIEETVQDYQHDEYNKTYYKCNKLKEHELKLEIVKFKIKAEKVFKVLDVVVHYTSTQVNNIKDTMINALLTFLDNFIMNLIEISQYDYVKAELKSICKKYYYQKVLHVTVHGELEVVDETTSINVEKQRKEIIRKMTLF